jgi:hypothetical protein
VTDWIDEFCAACREWVQRTGLPERYITGPLMVYSGGFGRHETAGKPGSDPVDYYSVEQLRDWYYRVTGETGMHDIFLIFASVKAMDSILEWMSEGYGQEMRRNREERDYWQAKLDEPNADAGEVEALRGIIGDLERRSVGSLDDLKRRRDALVVWREITAPLIGRTRFAPA